MANPTSRWRDEAGLDFAENSTFFRAEIDGICLCHGASRGREIELAGFGTPGYNLSQKMATH